MAGKAARHQHLRGQSRAVRSPTDPGTSPGGGGHARALAPAFPAPPAFTPAAPADPPAPRSAATPRRGRADGNPGLAAVRRRSPPRLDLGPRSAHHTPRSPTTPPGGRPRPRRGLRTHQRCPRHESAPSVGTRERAGLNGQPRTGGRQRATAIGGRRPRRRPPSASRGPRLREARDPAAASGPFPADRVPHAQAHDRRWTSRARATSPGGRAVVSRETLTRAGRSRTGVARRAPSATPSPPRSCGSANTPARKRLLPQGAISNEVRADHHAGASSSCPSVSSIAWCPTDPGHAASASGACGAGAAGRSALH